MLWSDRAFSIYIGEAGEGIDPARGDAATDVLASTAQRASEDCIDDMAAPSGGWFTRAISALADRAALTRIARS